MKVLFISLFYQPNGQRSRCCRLPNERKPYIICNPNFRSDNFTSSAELFLQRRPPIPSSTESVCSHATKLSPGLSFGSTWSANTKSVKFKVKSCQPARSSRRIPTTSRTTASFSDIWPVLTPSTCTRNLDQTLSAVPWASSTSTLPVNTAVVLKLFRSSEPPSWRTKNLEDSVQLTLPQERLASQLQTRESVLLLLLLEPPSKPTDQFLCEQVKLWSSPSLSSEVEDVFFVIAEWVP